MFAGLWLSLCVLAGSLPCPAQTAAPHSAADAPLARPAHDWAVEAARNELPVIEYNGVYLRYRIHMVGARGDQVRDVIESKDGTVARLILKENRPLTPEEDAAEHERLQAMLDSPEAFKKHIKSDQSGKKLALDLVKLTPDAMLFDYAPGQPQRPGVSPDASEVVLDFKPAPNWNPPAEALTGLQGRVWIDPRTQHVTRLEATVFRGVNLGLGVIAHINPGGKVAIEQVGLSDKRWIFSHFVEHVSLRALMVKTITQNSQIDSSDFTRIPPMSYQDAIETLLDTPLPH
jgi:hypothetical protein